MTSVFEFDVGFDPCFHFHFGLLICTLVSENQGLEKSRSTSNLRKISGPVNLDFFLEKKLDLYHKPEKNPGVQDLKFF